MREISSQIFVTRYAGLVLDSTRCMLMCHLRPSLSLRLTSTTASLNMLLPLHPRHFAIAPRAFGVITIIPVSVDAYRHRSLLSVLQRVSRIAMIDDSLVCLDKSAYSTLPLPHAAAYVASSLSPSRPHSFILSTDHDRVRCPLLRFARSHSSCRSSSHSRPGAVQDEEVSSPRLASSWR